MTSKIDKKITGYSIKKDIQQDNQDIIDDKKNESVFQILDREDELKGTTYKIKPDDYAYYITINNYNGLPFEIFINTKDTQHQQFITALTRTLSSLWRYGQDASHIIEEYKGIQDPNNSYWAKIPGRKDGKKMLMPSLVAHIGHIIGYHCSLSNGSIPVHNDDEKFIKCPECKEKKAILMDGCLVCLNCNYSKCG